MENEPDPKLPERVVGLSKWALSGKKLSLGNVSGVAVGLGEATGTGVGEGEGTVISGVLGRTVADGVGFSGGAELNNFFGECGREELDEGVNKRS